MIELVEISLVLLALLTVLLCGGVWIAVSLMAVGWVGMQFVGGNIPAGPVLATTIWGSDSVPLKIGYSPRGPRPPKSRSCTRRRPTFGL